MSSTHIKRRKMACDYDSFLQPFGGPPTGMRIRKQWANGGRKVVVVATDAHAVLRYESFSVSLQRIAKAAKYSSCYVGLHEPITTPGAPARIDGVFFAVTPEWFGFQAAMTMDNADGAALAPARRVDYTGQRDFVNAERDLSTALDPDIAGMLRTAAAAMAAIADPAYLLRVGGTAQPGAGFDGAKKHRERSAPFRVLRLAPTKAPSVEIAVRAPQPRRALFPRRGIAVGGLIAQHDVRGFFRRHITTAEHAENRGWRVVERHADATVTVAVPVRPHVRGKGPRKDVLIVGGSKR